MERARLFEALEQRAKYPAMYGTPEALEESAKHLSHVLIRTTHPNWKFEATGRLWAEIEKERGLDSEVARDRAAHQSWHWWHWGANELTAHRQVIAGFSRTWAALRNQGSDCAITSQWIETILKDEIAVGTPDVLEGVLFGLISVAFADRMPLFRSIYGNECKSVGGSSVRRLCDIGSESEWMARAPSKTPDFHSYPWVSSRIQELIHQLRAGELDPPG